MRRRQLLEAGLSSLSLGLSMLWLKPSRAWAMGGALPNLGEPAPPIELSGVQPGSDGGPEPITFRLADRLGSWTVIYFYPKDFTSGCTLEARGFQQDLAAFQAAGATIVGISADDPDQHAEFCGSEGLRYTLLSDPKGQVSQRYGSWIPPFSQRHTFLIDPQGVLQARWVAVRPAGHSQEVLAELRRLRAAAA